MPVQQNGHAVSNDVNPESGKYLLAAFGNPLLDLVFNVSNEEEEKLVKEFKIVKHVGQEYDTIGTGLFKKITERSSPIATSPGGCSLNTCRIFQWLCSSSEPKCIYFGGAGNDQNMKTLENIVQSDYVQTNFAVQPSQPTGHCLALVNGTERTMCAKLGAANTFQLEDMINGDILAKLENVQIIYVEGYFLSHSWDVASEVAKFCSRNNKTFAFNLCGEYVCEDISYVKNVLSIVDKVDLLFGNKYEFSAFIETAKKNLLKHEVLDGIKVALSNENNKNGGHNINKSLQQSIIITDGPNDITVVDRLSGEITSYGVPDIPSGEIKDTIGAGDSFIAGFLKGRAEKLNLDSCVRYGIYSSSQILRQNGTTLPDYEAAKWSEEISQQ